MCVSFVGRVEFTGTRGFACLSGDNSGRHFFSYQNQVQTPRSPFKFVPLEHPVVEQTRSTPWPALDRVAGAGIGNGQAMLLHVPVAAGGDLELVDMSAMPHFMADIERAIQPPAEVTRGAMFGLKGLGINDVRVETYGLYDVVIFRRADLVEAALGDVQFTRRPNVNTSLLRWYEHMYSKWAFLLACFSSEETAEAKSAQQFGVSYDPMYPQVLFFPGLDQHDGHKLPDLAGQVEVDHALAFSVPNLPGGKIVQWSDSVASPNTPLGKILPTSVLGRVYPKGDTEPNGDWVAEVESLRRGQLRLHRVQPPGAN